MHPVYCLRYIQAFNTVGLTKFNILALLNNQFLNCSITPLGYCFRPDGYQSNAYLINYLHIEAQRITWCR